MGMLANYLLLVAFCVKGKKKTISLSRRDMSEGGRYLEQKIFLVFVFSFVSTFLNQNKVCFLLNISSKENQFLSEKILPFLDYQMR